MIISTYERILILLILLFYLGFALVFSLEPIFEAPDEREHYEYIHTLAHERAFPDAAASMKEFFQAPLYYLLSAPVIMILGDDDFDHTASRLNPYRFIHGSTGWYQPGSDNKNVYLHSRAERFPYTGSETARAAHVLRLISVALGLVTLGFSMRIFRLVWPDRPLLRLMALGILATWPQFVYAMSAISNDVLLITLATIALWLSLRFLHEEPSRNLALALGITLGAALLTKFSALVVAGVVMLPLVINRRAWRFIPLVVIPVIVIAGWWYIRVWHIYGDPTGMAPMYEAWPGLQIPDRIPFEERWESVSFVYSTFWALLGTSTIAVRDRLYDFYDMVTVLALGGLGVQIILSTRHIMRRAGAKTSDQGRLFHLAKNPLLHTIVLCGLVVLALVAATIVYTFQNFAGNQGRFLFPGIAAWAILLVIGLTAWLPIRWQRLVVPLVLVAFGVSAILSAYDVHRAYHISTVPRAIVHPTHYTFEGYADLLGVESSTVRARPGDLVSITLYWRALRPSEASELLVYIHSVDAPMIRRDTYPATGNLISTDWESGMTWAERHIIRVPFDAEPGHVYPLAAGLYDPDAERTLTAVNINGEEITPIIGRVVINTAPREINSAYRFSDQTGDLITMAPPQITHQGEQLNVCLTWRAERPPSVDLALFVHLLDGAGGLITQHDGPAGSDYPTGVWARGEVVEQCITMTALDLPDNAQIVIGLYYFDSFTRLTVRDAAGNIIGDSVRLDPLAKQEQSRTLPSSNISLPAMLITFREVIPSDRVEK